MFCIRTILPLPRRSRRPRRKPRKHIRRINPNSINKYRPVTPSEHKPIRENNMTSAADYRELIDNISNFKSLLEKHYAPGTTYDARKIKMCPACGTAHDRKSQFCSFACSAIFKDIIIPKINPNIYDAERSTKDPLSYQEPINTTTWCGKGSVIYEDEQHSKVDCLDLSCDCHYPLLKTSTRYYTCIICNSYFRSFRNPIVCSVACALEFNKITNPPLSQRHHLIQDRLTHAYNEFNYA